MTKFIFVTGGVCSSLGKGIASASIGALLKASGLKVFTQKLDPYLNVDPGTMSPFQHGEVFVTEDGGETDLDLGHYERFIDTNLSKLSSLTTGKVYSEVLQKERKGRYLGRTIQIIPHITDCIQDKILTAAEKSECDIMMVEIGGTTGDIEGLPYLEAIRQLQFKLGKENTFFVHLTLLPYLGASKELKTKPTQASVRELRSIGLQPDMILARADAPIKKSHLKKIALFCDVDESYVIPAPTVSSIYEVPLRFEKHNITSLIADRLKLGKLTPDLENWEKLVKKIKTKKEEIKIALVGKYTGLDDAYLSVIEALKAASYNNNRDLDLVWVSSEKLENNDPEHWAKLKSAHGIVVPGGFGVRGTEGKIATAKYARENKIPYLGICLGMQIMTIEYARHILNNPKITSEEFDEDGSKGPDNHIIHFMEGQNNQKDKGGTLRLGSYDCQITPRTKTAKLYKDELIHERHRHRYEFNNKFRESLEKNRFTISGINPKQNLVEIVELKDHPYMIGCQFHPEFKSRPTNPHPLFEGLIKAAKNSTK
ncbi:CTP synthase [Candidatus Peregrinibacteria bacterium HGW-Peregrinibacteria-1]|nr:MAG: CTP synthase [Candidatus Peregrinibacteria bacterium HGW-Peregrinibacteria-1]